MAGQNNPFYGKTHTEESKKKMSLNHKDVSGKNNPMYGKHHSDEAKEKISQARKDIYIKDKCPSYGRDNPVFCVELNKTFKNPQDAAEFIGKDRRSGGDRINRLKRENKNKYAGYTWIFKNKQKNRADDLIICPLFFYSVSTGKLVLISLPPFAYLAKSITALNCLGSKLSTIFAAVSALAGKSSIN